MKHPCIQFASAALTAALTIVPAAQATSPSDSRWGHQDSPQRAFGITTDNALVRFSTARPRDEQHVGHVSGLLLDTKLIGVDFRVQDGFLYVVGNQGGIYTVDTRNAHATFVDRLDIALQGASFGVAFNPPADALRIVSDTGQNLRHPFAGATRFVTQNDAFLRFPPAPGATPVPAPGIAAAAYTNNDLDANTSTTLFDIDTALDQVVVQSPANSGNLVPTGKLGVDAGAVAGFDIHSRLINGPTVENRAFASLAVNERQQFYRIDLLTGRATFIGIFDVSLVDFAIQFE